MSFFIKQKYRIVYLALLLLTICSYLLLDHWVGTGNVSKAALVNIVAAIKGILILHYFMELDTAPTKAKAIAYSWVLVLVVLIVNMPAIAGVLTSLA